MGLYKKNDYMHMGRLRETALVKIARELGKEHEITKLMGSASYGRHEFETGPDVTLAKAVEYKAGLDGMFHVLHRAAHIMNDKKAIKSLQENFPRNYTTAP